MSDAELSELVERLDQLVPRDRARLRIAGGDDGNATLGPLPQSEPQPARLPLEIDYLLIGDEESPLGLCEVDEALEGRPAPKTNRLGPIAQLLAALAVVVLLVLVLIGASAVLGWILG